MKKKSKIGETGENSGETQKGQSSGSKEGEEESGSSKGQGEKQSQTGNSSDKINTTNMVTNLELGKNRNDINWESIKNDIQLLDESWVIITLDLHTLNVNSDTILGFSSKINKAMIAIKNEDKKQSLNAIADLYSDLPEFLREIDADKNMQKIRQTQSSVINAYILADDLGNLEINRNLNQAITTYSEIMSNIDYTKDKTEKTNKIYILLNELKNSVAEKDTDVFYIKYKNFMKEIEAL